VSPHDASGCTRITYEELLALLTADEWLALGWLLGKGRKTSPLRDDAGRQYKQHIGEPGAKDAFMRLLQSGKPLNPQFETYLACVRAEHGVSAMRLIEIRRRGKPELILIRRQDMQLFKIRPDSKPKLILKHRAAKGRPAHDSGVASVEAAIEESQVKAFIEKLPEGTKPYFAYREAKKKFRMALGKIVELRQRRVRKRIIALLKYRAATL
jgi:hypothetical protein